MSSTTPLCPFVTPRNYVIYLLVSPLESNFHNGKEIVLFPVRPPASRQCQEHSRHLPRRHQGPALILGNALSLGEGEIYVVKGPENSLALESVLDLGS